MTVKFVAIAILFLSSVFCFMMDDANQICTIYFGQSKLVIISQIDGTINEDILVFKIIAIITFIFSLVMAFISNKVIYAIVTAFFLGSIHYLLGRMLTLFDYTEVIRTSISMCNNSLMLLWLILLTLFLVLSLIYLIMKKNI